MSKEKNYEFVSEQVMMPFGLAVYSSSKEAEENGVAYVYEGSNLIAVKRTIEKIRAKDVAFRTRTPYQRTPPVVNIDQLKFLFKGITQKEVSSISSINLRDVSPKAPSKKESPSKPAVSTGNASPLFEGE